MLDIQLGRRNLSPIQRIAIAEKYRGIYEKQAKKNQLSGLKQNQDTVTQNSSKRIQPENKIDVRAKLAETAGVSTDTYSKGKKILDSDNEEVKKAVMSGEMSINAGYNKIYLLESNIRRRGEVGGSARKVGLRIKELERLYGIQNGSTTFQGNQHQEVVSNKSKPPHINQEQLAEQLGMSVATLQNYKLLADMIPELDELVSTGIVTKTTALAMMKKNNARLLSSM